MRDVLGFRSVGHILLSGDNWINYKTYQPQTCLYPLMEVNEMITVYPYVTTLMFKEHLYWVLAVDLDDKNYKISLKNTDYNSTCNGSL